MRGTGLVIVAAGAGLMAWALAAHCEAAPRGWALESGLTPQSLLRRGPYRLSRNPMYAAEAVVWLGWALFYGRPAIWAGLAIECAAFARATLIDSITLSDGEGQGEQSPSRRSASSWVMIG